MQVKEKLINKFMSFAKTHPILFGFILMIVSGFFIFISIKAIIPPPHIVTKYRFQVIENEINKVLQTNPQNKIDIELLSAMHINVFDGWGNKIILEHQNKTHYRLISFGEDRIVGGKPDLLYDIYIKK